MTAHAEIHHSADASRIRGPHRGSSCARPRESGSRGVPGSADSPAAAPPRAQGSGGTQARHPGCCGASPCRSRLAQSTVVPSPCSGSAAVVTRLTFVPCGAPLRVARRRQLRPAGAPAAGKDFANREHETRRGGRDRVNDSVRRAGVTARADQVWRVFRGGPRGQSRPGRSRPGSRPVRSGRGAWPRARRWFTPRVREMLWGVSSRC